MFSEDQQRIIRYQVKKAINSIDWVIKNKQPEPRQEEKLMDKSQKLTDILGILNKSLKESEDRKWNR